MSLHNIGRFALGASLMVAFVAVGCAPGARPTSPQPAGTATITLPASSETSWAAEEGTPEATSEAPALQTETPISTVDPTPSVTPAAEPTIEPTVEPTIEEPTPVPFEANFVSALAEARAQYPEFAPAFDTFENSPYPLQIHLADESGTFHTYYLKSDAQMSYELRGDRLFATVRIENRPHTAEMQWIPFNMPGVETKGFWGLNQFSTGLIDFTLGDSMIKSLVYKEKRWGMNMPDVEQNIIGAELEAEVDVSNATIDELGEYLGSNVDELSEYLRWIESVSALRFPEKEDLVIYNGLEDERLNEAAMVDRIIFHTFANSLFGTNDAAPEQIDAVAAYYYNTATPEQRAMIESTPSFTQHGKLAVSHPTGIWDLTNNGTPAVRIISQALPEEGERTVHDVRQFPYTPPKQKHYFDENGRLVIRLFADANWLGLGGEITRIAHGLGQTQDAEYQGFEGISPVHNFVQEYWLYAFVQNSKGEQVIVMIFPYGIKAR